MSTVAITLGGVNITNIIEYRSAFFESQANGIVGRCQFRIKDIPQTQAPVAGDVIHVSIDGSRVWAGWATKISRVFAFPVQDTRVPGSLTRYFLIDGSDVNLLFQKRFIFNQATPTLIKGPFYKFTGAPTSDTTALTDLFSDWIDLSGDGIDTSSLVEHVGNINVDQDANPFNAANSWGDAMKSIAAVESAIYYINPDYKLVYTDVDTTNAPFALSDHPTGGKVGYRSAEVFVDGSNLINDMIVWGTGKGSDHWVINRTQDATSEASHGRWQAGEVRFDMYKQGSVDKRANTIVYGSPNEKRGHKDDAISVRCTVKEPGLLVAQKVDFESQVHGYADTLPIRHLRLTFAGPTSPLYQLDLSQQIDTPYDTSERFWAPLPPVTIPPVGVVVPSLQVITTTPGGCTDCGITDTFTRTVGSGWGTSDSTIAWDTSTTSSSSVDGSSGTFSKAFTGFPGSGTASLRPTTIPSGGFSAFADGLTFTWTVAPPVANYLYLQFYFGGNSAELRRNHDGTQVLTLSASTAGTPQSLSLNLAAPFSIRASWAATVFSFKVWQSSDPEPAGWTATIASSLSALDLFWMSMGVAGGYTTTLSGTMGTLDITDVNRCSEYLFDRFGRSISWTKKRNTYPGSTDGPADELVAWGTSDYGTPWHVTQFTDPASSGGAGVSGTYGYLIADNATDGTPIAQIDTLPFAKTDHWSMKMRWAFYDDSFSPGGRYGGFQINFWNASLQVELATEAFGGAGTWSLFWDYPDYVFTADFGQWLILEMEYDPTILSGSLRIRAGDESAVWSDWGEIGTPPGNTPPFAIVLRPDLDGISGQNVELDVDYLDFGYPGKACYQVCSPFDTFTRTLPTTWGTSDAGIAWDSPFNSGFGVASVNGSSGVLTVDPGMPSPGVNSTSRVRMFPGWSNTVDITFDLVFLNLPGGSDGVTRFEFRWDSTNAGGVIFFLNQAEIQIDDNGGNFDSSATATGIDFTGAKKCRAQMDATGIRFKMWNASDAEPGTWTVADTWLDVPTESYLFYLMRQNATTWTALACQVDNISVTVDGVGVPPCQAVGPGTGSSTATTSRCIEQEGNPGSLVYTFAPYIGGTSTLTINGIFQRLNTDYFETDPVNGIVTLTSFPDRADVLNFCADGPVNTVQPPGGQIPL